MDKAASLIGIRDIHTMDTIKGASQSDAPLLGDNKTLLPPIVIDGDVRLAHCRPLFFWGVQHWWTPTSVAMSRHSRKRSHLKPTVVIPPAPSAGLSMIGLWENPPRGLGFRRHPSVFALAIVSRLF